MTMVAAGVRAVVARLASPRPDLSDAERIELIRALEELKGAACAAQAREAVAFRTSQLAEQEAAGVPASQRGRGISAQVALARRESPHKAARLMGLAQALVHEMPHTLTALESGQISEWRATLVVRETACLSAADRRTVDTELAGRLTPWGDRQTAAETQKIAYRIDPHAVVARARKAETERCVTLRPAPDTMTYLTALLPVTQGVAAYAALTQAAGTANARGDDRSRGQVMADTLVERLTGQSTAAGVDVEVQLVVSDTTLAGESNAPGHLTGHGPVPAPWARELVRKTDARVFLRRLYSRSGQLVAMENTRRLFGGNLRRFLVARDQTCRTPWCDAPIRHADHVIGDAAGGPTAAANGQGLCEACNYAKEALGWSARAPDATGQTVVTRTPTGHQYSSHPPDLPGRRARSQESRLDAFYREVSVDLVA